MRTFSAGFQSKLDANTFLPVVFCKYELKLKQSTDSVQVLTGFDDIFNKTFISVDSLTQEEIDLYLSLDLLYTPVYETVAGSDVVTYFWSERAITYNGDSYEARIVNTAPLEQVLGADNQAFSSMGLQIANTPSNIAGVIQAAMKCTVYIGFEDDVNAGTVTDAEIIFIGTVEGDIEITEDSVSFSLQDIAHTYDRQIPELITRNEYSLADPDAIGDTKPIIMGRVVDHVCRPVGAGNATVLALDTAVGDSEIYVTDDIGWWLEQQSILGQLIINTAYDPDGGVSVDWNETVTITDIVFDRTQSLWKIQISEPLQYNHYAGDTTYIDDDVFTVIEGYVYLVADHAVESISNVKVDGLPPSQAIAVTNYDGSDSYMNLAGMKAGKSYVIVAKNPGINAVAGASGLEIVDTTDVVDSIDVVDTINVNEPGHNHLLGTSLEVYQYEIDFIFSYIKVANGTGYISVNAGGEFWYLRNENGSVLQNPLTITSTSKSLNFYAAGTSLLGLGYDFFNFNYIYLNVKRTSQSGAVAYYTTSFTNVTHPTSATSNFGPDFLQENATQIDFASVVKIGDASKDGTVVKTGAIDLIAGNSAADVFVGQTVTCDVVGICDGTSGFVYPHQMIKKLINKYARNPISGTEGSADIVQFVNESEADAYFAKLYNTALTDSASDYYPVLNQYFTDFTIPDDYINQSPSVALNQDSLRGIHALDFSITEPNRLRDVIGDMLYQANCTLTWRNGIAYIRFVPDEPSNDATVTKSEIVMKSMSLARSRSSDLANDIAVRYDHSQKSDYKRIFDYKSKVSDGGFPPAYSYEIPDSAGNIGRYSKERTYDLTMVREQVSAEIIAKRLFAKYSRPKFNSSVSTTIKNLAFEAGDFVTVNTPIYSNGILDRGLLNRCVIEFGSAVDQTPDLIHLSLEESHIPIGFYLGVEEINESVSVSDSYISVVLNDANTLFTTLADSISLSEQIAVNKGIGPTDSVSIGESLAFEFEVSLSDSVTINDNQMKFTGILFWAVDLSDSITATDEATATAVDSVFEEGVFVWTDLENVGVFQ